MKLKLGILAVLSVGALTAACSNPTPGATEISGTIDQATFPAQVTTVVAMKGTQIASQSDVAADGSFNIVVPKGTGYQIELITGKSTPQMIFPRSGSASGDAQTTRLDSSFNVSGGGAFDLGRVRYIGDPTTYAYTFKSPADGDTDDVECEDGIDANTGAVCVDDDAVEASCEEGDNVECEDGIDANTGAACAEDDDEGAADENDGDNVECEDGIDANTGAACADDDDEADDDENDTDNVECEDGIDANTGAACADDDEADDDENDTDNVECEDGIDANTGAACAEDDDESDSKSTTEAAVPEHNLPASVGNCDETEED